jgi:DNA-directed RNA polymerase specialized sigma24 family protein
MGAPRSLAPGEGTDPSSAGRTCEIYARILRGCAAAGLAPADAQDVAQEIFVWLVQSGRSPTAAEPSWNSVVVRNYIHRYWRRRAVRRARESRAAYDQTSGPPPDAARSIEARLVLDKLGRNLPLVEARLLRLIRDGCTFAEAVRSLGVPRGSWSYFKRRLVGHLKAGLRPSRRASLSR